MSDHREDHFDRHQAGGPDPILGDLDANARVAVRKNSTGTVVKRRRINTIEGTAILLTLADDAVNEEADLTIAVNQGALDHGSIGGLADDDHTQYTRKDTLTTRGDLYYRDASAVVRKALGASGTVLTSDGTDANWTAPAAPAKHGVKLRRTTNQSISNAATTAITWPTEDTDTDAFHAASSASIVVPSGQAGVYGLMVRVQFQSDPAGACGLLFDLNGTKWAFGIPTIYWEWIAGFGAMELAVSDTIQIFVGNFTGAAISVQGQVEMFKFAA